MIDSARQIQPTLVELSLIKARVARELIAVDTLIQARLLTNTSLTSKVCKHLLLNGGKRLRPLLLLLTAQLFQYTGEEHILLATVLEFLHAATLLHDDVIDNSGLRHHRKTANAIWGNTTSVLVGDYLHVLSFQILNQLAHPQVTEIIVNGTRITVEGEIMQLTYRNLTTITETNYLDIICKKTAQFFSVAAQLGAVIAGASQNDIQAMADYGKYLGMAYQLIDDLLDYSGDTSIIGKNRGDDLTEGKPTLPLLYAMHNSTEADAEIIRRAIIEGGIEKFDTIASILRKTKALEYTALCARAHVDQAIASLQALSKHKQQSYESLEQLAEFVLQLYKGNQA